MNVWSFLCSAGVDEELGGDLGKRLSDAKGAGVDAGECFVSVDVQAC